MDVLNPSARQYTVAGLKPESVYVFRITAQTRKGWGEAAEALVVITEKRGKRSNQRTVLTFAELENVISGYRDRRLCLFVKALLAEV